MSQPLVCDCGTEFHGVDSATCSNGHKAVRMDWWPVCECGHASHYDMTTFCMTEGCACEEYREGATLRQVTRRSV